MAPLTPLKLYRGDPTNELVESFSGYTDLSSGGVGAPLQARYHGNAVTIAAGAPVRLPWNARDVGDDLLDLSVPTFPVPKVSGLYIVSVYVEPVPPVAVTVGYEASLSLVGLVQQEVRQASPVPFGADLPLSLTTAAILAAGAGGPVLTVENQDVVNPQDWRLVFAAVAVLPLT